MVMTLQSKLYRVLTGTMRRVGQQRMPHGAKGVPCGTERKGDKCRPEAADVADYERCGLTAKGLQYFQKSYFFRNSSCFSAGSDLK